MNITIQCKNIAEINAICGMDIEVELYDVDLKFIEDLPIDKIVSYADNKKLLKAILEDDEDLQQEVIEMIKDKK